MSKITDIINEYPNLKYAYYTDINDDEVVIDTSNFTNNLSEIESTTLLQDTNCIISHSLYPKGFEILTIQEADNIEFRTNYPLQKDSSGRYQVLFD